MKHGSDQAEASRGTAALRRTDDAVNGGRGMLPLGMQTFREVRESGTYYVDKTGFAHKMITEGKCYFLSRPRRFGKSLLVSTLKELFEGAEELFEGLFIHDRWDWSVSRPVLRLSFGSGDFTEPGKVQARASEQLSRIDRAHQLDVDYETLEGRFTHILEELHRRTGRRAAVLIDEYDKPILDAIDDSNLARENRDFLRGFYGCLKDADEHLRFVFLTGVSKFSKVSLFSGLNNLKDITINPAYSSICGFTEADLDRVFAPELEGLDRDLVREWYNGYSWLGPEKVYNPYDVLKLLDERRFRAHWFETATPTLLINTLIERAVPTPSLTQPADEDSLLSSFDIDHISTEALLFQTGYLTITGEHDDDGDITYQLDYPNREVRQSLNKKLLKKLVGNTTAAKAKRTQLLKTLHQGNTTGLRRIFDEFFAGIPHQWHTRGRAARYETYYTSIFYTYFTACGLDARVEDPTNRGRVDMALHTPQHIWIFEFKTTTHTTEGAALQQIHNRGYHEKYLTHNLPIILVGIEFNPETRTIAHYDTTTIQPNPQTP